MRELLNGRLANTSFCVFDPTGKKRLSRSGRSPHRGLSSGENSEENDKVVVRQMHRIASQYEAKGESSQAELQSFHSFRQALNVASADQRLLVLVNTKDDEKIAGVLKPVFADKEVIGKFHLHFANAETDQDWSKVIQDDKNQPGIVIIRAGKFGLDGVVMNQLPAATNAEELKAALIEANQEFAKLEDRKTYKNHVKDGRREWIYFENEISQDNADDGRNSRSKRNNRNGNRKGRRR